MKKGERNLLDTIVSVVIGIPISVVVLVLLSPYILYMSVVKGPIHTFKQRRFLDRNAGKIVLCTSPGGKYKLFREAHIEELVSIGIHDVIVFDPTRPNNYYDGFEWDGLISRNLGFPILIKFTSEKIIQQSMKNEFITFFKKDMDLIQLKGCIKRTIDGKSY